MYSIIITAHVALAFILILSIVLFQTSKGSALSMFGGGGDSLFNAASGTSFIKKLTAGCAALFAATSLLLTVFSSSARFHSVVQQYPLQAPPAAQQPAAPKPGAMPVTPLAAPAAPAAPAKAAPAPVKK